ncbi:5'-nucleotidase [Aquibacillus koreensis]|uniref:5'-nucleotidase n=1 Tax=Aquibacillus koreensis TaxID=279446 RepID=UPI0038996D0D
MYVCTLGGTPKEKVLKAFGAHFYFDDQEIHFSTGWCLAQLVRLDGRQKILINFYDINELIIKRDIIIEIVS